MSENQYRFQSHNSTSLPLPDLNKEITAAIERKQYTVGLFTDLRKAFDTKNHSLLLSKLQDCGIRKPVK